MDSLWQITIHQQRLIKLLAGIAVGLVLLHVGGLVVGPWSWQAERTFRLSGEANVPTWASSLLWALAALAAVGCGQRSSVERHQRTWRLAALGLLFLSCDEVAMLHEELGRVVERLLKTSLALSPSVWIPWSVTLGPLMVVGAAWIWRRLRECLSDSPAARRRIQAGLLVFLTGAIGLELIEKLLLADWLEWARRVEVVIEESCEMFGGLAILSGLLLHQRPLQQQPEGTPRR